MTITEDELITWDHQIPTPDELHAASDLADHLSESAFMQETNAARAHALQIIALLWPHKAP